MNLQQQIFGRMDDFLGALPAPSLSVAPSVQTFNRLEDRQFLQMHHAYARTGGLLSGSDVAHRLRRFHDQPLSTLGRWIVARSIVHFEWRSHILVPLFQFDAEEMALRPVVVNVLQELCEVLGDWELAHWFVQPNCWLSDAAPVDALGSEPEAVIDAARADRYIARG